MMDDGKVWSGEKRFWLEGSEAFDALMDDECLMVFPGMGVMPAMETRDALRHAPRWSSVDFADCKIARPDADTLVLAYKAEGHRDGDAPYRAYCSSTYRCHDHRWKLVQHQQTPLR
ncbi:hypothetical protein J2R99_000185 [Rhodopseudomonas julia]|uniref:DUF4440 domain-containing protein n=1 Tax=Rhodopseudomonas julia TaxID=200617 RepID=A0ABU0C340_9BRAD|nr:nuclear transport factor 2 family protein [Rhodopseudomonas julia]MDQ0324336.1 hypothetical protein [Rhodopseudomonas julia]